MIRAVLLTVTAATALAAPAQAAPFRVQADVGGFVNFSDEPFGGRGRTLLGRFGAVDDPGLERDVVFGLTATYRPVEVLELGVSARRIATGWRYALREEPSIAQRQDTESWPMMAIIGLRSAQGDVILRGGAGVGMALSEVTRRGYLDDSGAKERSLCASGYAGVGYLTSIGLELGVELVYLHFTLPETHPIMPVEGDGAVNGLVLGVTLGFQGK
jgi:hypothetical protein